ncbi:HK97-gp10 family putative phage morphogenesis protein [Levilactobacillus namurensis]|uniref:HK97-gp10 family putative phage morphogenesis protein n=1 Tax=Levilactobacillus namurensis TaxID=380393 RepID=UPI000463D911|nr:HK97-gp10 family putative phage morphogenesis protein [Levilactobacillus namurensis]
MSSNGFEDFSKILSKIKVDKATTDGALQAGADEYVKALRPRLPSDPSASMAKRYGPMSRNLKTFKRNDSVAVTFGDSFWWRFVDKGTPTIAAQNFTRTTLDSNKKRIGQLMTKKIMKEMGL